MGNSLTLGQTAVSSTADELNILDGVTATATEINYLDGVLSTVKNAYDEVEYNTSTGVLSFSELDNGTDTVDIGVGTTDNPTFAGIRLTQGDTVVHTWGEENVINDKRTFNIQTNVPLLTTQVASTHQTIQSNMVTSKSIVVASTSHSIPVLITNVTSGTFQFHFYNNTSGGITGEDSVVVNFSIISQ